MNKTEILNRLDKSKFYQGLIPSLKVNGKPEALGLCPFHDDTNPSLSVNVETGLFRCFSCDAKGDIFTFYQRVKGVDFTTALQEIGEMVGIADTNVKPKVVATFKYYDSDSQNLACSQLGNESGNNKNSDENHQEKNACSLVPSIGKEQQNNNINIAETPGGCREDACTHVPLFPEVEKKLRVQAFLEEIPDIFES